MPVLLLVPVSSENALAHALLNVTFTYRRLMVGLPLFDSNQRLTSSMSLYDCCELPIRAVPKSRMGELAALVPSAGINLLADLNPFGLSLCRAARRNSASAHQRGNSQGSADQQGD